MGAAARAHVRERFAYSRLLADIDALYLRELEPVAHDARSTRHPRPRPACAGIARSFSALLSGELANKVLRFGATAVLARSLSPSEFGLFNVGIAAGGILVVADDARAARGGGPRGRRVAPSRALSSRGPWRWRAC